MSEWQEIRIKEFANVVAGGTPSTGNDEYWNGNIGWITPADLSNYKFRYISNGERNITELGLQKSSACLLPKNTVLLSSRAPIGYVAIAETELATNQGFKNLVCDETKADYRFIYYWLSLNTEVLKSFASGATFPEISASNVKRIKAILPDIPTQKRIADILSAYDDLIENNNRRIALLEKAAQELYKEWFVRFRFPGYENAKFENGLPEGWERTTFEKIASFQNGYAFKSNELLDSAEPNTYEVFKQGHIKRGGGFKAEGTKSWYHKSLCTGLQKFVLHKKDVLMAMTDMKDNVAILGNTAIMPYDNRYILNQRVGLLRPTHYRGTDFAYIHLLTNSYDFVQDLRSRANRGVQVNLSAVQIRESETVVPSEIINKKFAKIMDPIFEEIFNIMIQSENLAKQRDLLLPRLMSGKIDIDNKKQAEVLRPIKLSYDEFLSELGMAARAKRISDADLKAMYEAYLDDETE